MNALAFIFRPVWVAAVNFAHLMALVLAVGGVLAASRRNRRLALVLLLAAMGWLVNTAVSIRLAAATAPGGALAWAPLAGDLPVWAAVAVALVRVRR